MREVADKRTPVTREFWEGLSDLKRPKETFAKPPARDDVEHEKKRRLFLDMDRIEREGNFVELRI
ncbi:MAG: hypothetical protein QM433_01690 [Euryarchaeota archaeon]|jgi:hypothetical protein|nr:hypothetical protein [Euryarchaeota archaeon]